MAGRHMSAQDEMIKELQQAIDGVRKHFSGQTLLIDGKEMTAEDIIATFQRQIDLIHKTQAAYADWQKAAKHKRELLANLDDESLAALRELVKIQFGEDSEEYRQLITPRRRPRRSAEAKARGAEAARSGAGARHARSGKGRPAGQGTDGAPEEPEDHEGSSSPDDDDAN